MLFRSDRTTIRTETKSSSSTSSVKNSGENKKKIVPRDIKWIGAESVEKRKKDTVPPVPPVDNNAQKQSQSQSQPNIGHIVGGKNRFYDSDKKVKRKKLRSR